MWERKKSEKIIEDFNNSIKIFNTIPKIDYRILLTKEEFRQFKIMLKDYDIDFIEVS